MGKKKHLQGIDETDMEYIDSKFKSVNSSNGNYDYNPQWANYDYKVNIKCKNQKQKEFLNSLKDDDKNIVIGVGKPGTGKSYLSLAYALSVLKNSYGKYKQIIIVIPTCVAGHPSMQLGYLPGSYEEKMLPFITADSNTMETILEDSGNYSCKSTIQGLIRNGVIQFEIIGYMRGRSYKNSLILGSEIENLNRQEMLLLLTRIGEGSKMILTGDIEQCDRSDIKKGDNRSGIEYALDKLKDLPFVGITEFDSSDIVRNPIITDIIAAWNS